MPGLYDQFQWVPGEALNAMGNYDQSQANSNLEYAHAAQQQAETQQYTSQTAQALREAQRQAAISEAGLQQFQSDTTKQFYNSNPGLYQKSLMAGVQSKISDELSKKSDDDINYLGNTIGASVNKQTGKIDDPTDYSAQFNKANKENPDLVASLGFPTPDQVANDPTGKALKTANMLAVHTLETRQENFKNAELTATLQNKDEMNERMADVKMQVGNMMYQRGVDMAKLGIEASRVKGSAAADINGQYKLQQQSMRDAAAQKGKVLNIKDYGPMKDQIGLVGASIQDYLQQPGIDVDASKVDINGLVSNSYSAAMDKYNQLKDQYLQDKKEGKPAIPPPPPTELALDIAKQIISDPEATKKVSKGYIFTSQSVDSSGAKDIVRGSSIPTTTSSSAPQTTSKKISDLSPAVQEALAKKTPEQQKAFKIKWNITD
jgi:hypothetical protein